MKKLLLSFVLLALILASTSYFVHADTDLFDETKIVYAGQDNLIYTDTTLVDGYYQLVFGSPTITAQPDNTNSTFESNGVTRTFSQALTNIEYVSGTWSAIAYVFDGHFEIKFLDSSTLSVFSEGVYNVDIFFLDVALPVFTYSTLTYQTSYADPITVAEIMAEITVTDDVDGDISDRLTVYEDLYSASAKTIGEIYAVTFSASDTSGNTAYITVEIEIIDDVAPVLWIDPTVAGSFMAPYVDSLVLTSDSGNSKSYTFTYELPLNQSLQDLENASEIIGWIQINEASLYLYDNTYTLIPVTYTSNFLGTGLLQYWIVEQVQADFDSSYDPYGYDIILYIYDETNNETELILHFVHPEIVLDETIPTFTEESPTKIVKPQGLTLTEASIRSQMVVTDTFDDVADLTISIVSDTYTGHENTLGRWQIVYQVVDLAGNTSTHTVVIWVIDATAPVVTVTNDFFVSVSSATPMTEQEIIDMLALYGIIVTNLSYDVTILDDDYLGFETITGTHTMILQLDFSDGSQQVITLSIDVFTPDSVSSVNYGLYGVGGLGVLFIAFVILKYRHRKPKYIK